MPVGLAFAWCASDASPVIRASEPRDTHIGVLLVKSTLGASNGHHATLARRGRVMGGQGRAAPAHRQGRRARHSRMRSMNSTCAESAAAAASWRWTACEIRA
jgi:hypothetical protein